MPAPNHVCNHAPSPAHAVKSGAMYWMVIATLTSGLPGGTNATTRRRLLGRGQDMAGQRVAAGQQPSVLTTRKDDKQMVRCPKLYMSSPTS